MEYPFVENKITKNFFIRKFSSTIDNSELNWHMDNNDRSIFVISGEGWMFQEDNTLPVTIKRGSAFQIRKNSWHRLIKGNGELIILIAEDNL